MKYLTISNRYQGLIQDFSLGGVAVFSPVNEEIKALAFLVCHHRKFTAFTVAASRKKESGSRRKLQELDFSSLIKYRKS